MYAHQSSNIHGLKMRPVFQARDFSSTPMKNVATLMAGFSKKYGQQNVDGAAVQYYLSNQAFHLIEAKYGSDEKLPPPIAKLAADHIERLNILSLRMFYYLITTCAEEACFARAKNDNLFDFIENSTSVDAAKMIRSLLNRSGGRSYFSNCGEATVGEAVKAIEMTFRFAQWSPGFGGLPWAQITQTAYEAATGSNSFDLMVDKAFTLCHNNGAIFNKGHFFSMYSGSFYTVLDIQASGQIPNAIHAKHSAAGFQDKDSLALYKDLLPHFKDEFEVPFDAKKVKSMESVRNAKAAAQAKAASSFLSGGGGYGGGVAQPPAPPQRPCDNLITMSDYEKFNQPKVGF